MSKESILPNDMTSSLLLVEDGIVTLSASSSAARTRRREIEDNGIIDTPASKKKLKSMTTTNVLRSSTDDLLAPPLVASTADSDNLLPIITILPSRGGPTSHKRPQLKYDPAIPMLPLQTSAWRAEQRRKRNCESAAACRRKQREMVSVLEIEVANWKRKFDDAIALVKAREGGDAASKLADEIKRTHVIQPSKITSTETQKEEKDATDEDSDSYGSYSPPPSQCVPDKIESSSMDIGSSSDGLSNIVSPAYDKGNNNFLEAYSFETMNNDEDMYFPILDNDDDDDNNYEHYYKEFKTISRIKEDNNTNSKKKKKNKRHLSELITTSAEGINFVRLLRNNKLDDRNVYETLTMIQ